MSIFVDVCTDSLRKSGEELCGDKVEIVRLDDSVIIVLADGLGSGVKANILASMTSKMLATMLMHGMELEDAVSTVAATLPVCHERKIAYSTFTILQVYPAGIVKLIEFDNPPTVFLREGKYCDPKGRELLLGGKKIRESYIDAQIGDFFVAMSDGAIHAGIGHTLNLGWQWPNIREFLEENVKPEMTCGQVTQLLLGACNDLYMQHPGDDTTVVCVKMRRAVPVSLLIGPPVNPDDDEQVVHDFLSDEGIKIVCGGTTSQIVSRVTGRKLQVDLRYADKNIPPCAHIEGIELTTEGVLTFGGALEIIRQYIKDDRPRYLPCTIDGQDGASKIARILLEQATSICLMVGRAMNPAHQNPGLPLDFGIKLRLVEEMANCLRLLGKKVEVHYY